MRARFIRWTSDARDGASLHPPDAHLAQAGELLAGAVLLAWKGPHERGAPLWLQSAYGCAEYRVPLF